MSTKGHLFLTRGAALAAILALGACASADAGGQRVGFSGGGSCQTVRAELNKLDARGTGPKVEAANAGKKLSPRDQEDVRRYNVLLEQYLGNQCHV